MSGPSELTKEELAAIRSLKRLARKWPASLWVFAGGQDGLAVLKCDENGEKVHTPRGNIDQDYCVDTIDGIRSDGGDW